MATSEAGVYHLGKKRGRAPATFSTMVSLGGLRRHLLLALTGAAACAPRESVESTPRPAPPLRGSERATTEDPRFATPPGETGTANCQYPLTRYCFAPHDQKKILASCGMRDKPEDASGCLTREGYASCGVAVTTGPSLENGLCCYQVCQEPARPGGRPLSVADGHRRAGATHRSDWAVMESWPAEPIDATTRSALARAWTEDALTEHASVASFARFTLELLAVGAPAELLSDAQRGAGDEIEHARLCFALGSRFGGSCRGPGPLDLAGVRPRQSLREIVLANVAEGCVAESIGAALALEQLDGCTDEATRRALERIARDEADHAALAWRFVAWALRVAPELGADVRRSAEAELALWTACTDDGRDVDPAAWRRYGRLQGSEASEAVRQAARAVVLPCLDALVPRTATPIEHAPVS